MNYFTNQHILSSCQSEFDMREAPEYYEVIEEMEEEMETEFTPESVYQMLTAEFPDYEFQLAVNYNSNHQCIYIRVSKEWNDLSNAVASVDYFAETTPHMIESAYDDIRKQMKAVTN